MDLTKDRKNKSGKYSVIIGKTTHEKIKKQAYLERSNNKEIVKKAVDLYLKTKIFDSLIK